MRKHFVTGLMVLAFALGTPVALAQGEGSIEAQVVNGTEGGGSVEGLTVTLRAFQSMTSELESQTAVADAEGRVRFEGLDTLPDVVYLLSAVYAGVEYNSAPLSFEEGGETTLSAPLLVYETTENPDEAAIQVERMHIFVDFQDGVMSVGELQIFSNASDRAFIGAEDPALGRRVTLRFALPEGAQDLRFQMGDEGGRYVVTDDGFVDTAAVQPGAGQQVLYAYTLSYGQADTFDLVRPLLYRTANVNVLAPRVGVQVTSEQVELSEIRTLEGQAYLNLNGQDLAAGDELSIHFGGLQDLARQSATPGAAQSRLDPRWLALGLAALALVGGVIYPSVRRVRKVAPARESSESAAARRARLLQAIADLDDAFEAGQVDAASYGKQRQALKSEALSLMRES
jgi:hypothetical protein